MIKNLDFEKILTQLVIVAFAVAFICVTCWAKVKIESKYRKNVEKIKKSKALIKRIKLQEVLLSKKVLYETTNRHQHSIIASSLKQTIDEELERLQHISDSIKRVQFPHVLENLQNLALQNKSSLLSVNAPVVSYLTKDEDLEDRNKLEPEAEPKLLQSRMCKTWGTRTRKGPIVNGGIKRKSSIQKRQGKHFKSVINNQFLEAGYSSKLYENNHLVCNTMVEYDKDNKHQHCPRKLIDTVETNKLSTDNVIKSVYLGNNCKNDDDSAVYTVKENSSLYCFVKNKQENKCELKKTQQNNSNTIYYNTEKNFDSKEILTKKLNTHSDLKIQQNKTLYKKPSYGRVIKTRNVLRTKQNTKIDLQIDLVGCIRNKVFSKIIIRNKKNKSIQIHEKFENGINITSSKTRQVYLRQGIHTHNFKNVILKVPLKINNKRVILKLIFCFVMENKRNGSQFIPAKQIPWSCGRTQTGHTIRTIPNYKRHSLYTSSSFGPAKEENVKTVCSLAQYAPFSVGDNQISQQDSVIKYLNPLYSSQEGKFSEWALGNSIRDIIDRTILKQHIGLGKDFLDCSDIAFDYFPQLMCHLANSRSVLETIQEESDEGICDETTKSSSESIQGTNSIGSTENILQSELTLNKVNNCITKCGDINTVFSNNGISSSNEDHTIMLEGEVSRIVELIDLERAHKVAHNSDEAGSLYYSADFESKSDSINFDMFNFFQTEDFNYPMTEFFKNLTSTLLNGNDIKGKSLVRNLNNNLQKVSNHPNDGLCSSESHNNFLYDEYITTKNFIEDTMCEEEPKIHSSIVLEEGSLLVSESIVYLKNSGNQLEENLQNSSNDLVIIESPQFGIEDCVENYIWCERLSQFQFVENDCLSQNSTESDGRIVS